MAKKNLHKNQKLKLANQEPVTSSMILSAMDRENSQEALELAKTYSKEHPGAESERLLALAYQLRVRKLLQSGLVEDAKNLIAVAKGKCPRHTTLFDAVECETFHYPLTDKDVSKIAQWLYSSTTSDEKKESLLDILRVGLGNPRHIVDCASVPSEAPLKQEAAIVLEAVAAVAGSCSDEKREASLQKLSMVSRHSPLSGWCFFARALEAFHQNEDQRTLDLLNRISDDSTLFFAKKILVSKIQKRNVPDGLSSHATRSIWKLLTPESPAFLWRELRGAIEARDRRKIRDVVRSMFQSELFSTPIMTRILVRLVIENMVDANLYDAELTEIFYTHLNRYWGTKSLILLKLSIFDALRDEIIAASFEQLDNAMRESENYLSNQEKAAIHAHVGHCASQSCSREHFPFHAFDFGELVDPSISIRYYKTACRLDPLPEYFELLVDSMVQEKEDEAGIDEVLQQWSESNPNDCRPFIRLFERAEKRNALQKSLKFLERAEAIDRLHPKVRKARLRLVWHTIRKHLQQKKWHLVEKDLNQIDISDLPPVQKSLFEEVPRYLALIQNHSDPGSGERNPLISEIVMHHLAGITNANIFMNQFLRISDLNTGDKLETYFTLREVLFDLDSCLYCPKQVFDQLPKWIAMAEPISNSVLLRISQSILSNCNSDIVIASTARGLEQDGPHLHEFLYYRALALLEDSTYRVSDVQHCLEAVITLARARGDYEIVTQATKTIQSLYANRSHFWDEDDFSVQSLSDLEIEEVLEKERRRSRPKTKRKKAVSKTKKASPLANLKSLLRKTFSSSDLSQILDILEEETTSKKSPNDPQNL